MSLPTKNESQKRVYGNGGIFLPWDSYEACWVSHFYTTHILCICVKVLFICTNIVQSKSLTKINGFSLDDLNVRNYYWYIDVLVCQSRVVEPHSRLMLSSRNPSLFFDDSYIRLRFRKKSKVQFYFSMCLIKKDIVNVSPPYK